MPAAIPRDARILVVRLSAIGDIVFASPLIASLRRACPGAYIAWLAQPECIELLDRHPDLDEAIPCPVGHWRRLWRERRFAELKRCVQTMGETLRARDFDVALDLQGLMKSGLLTRLSGARTRVGLGSKEGSRWLMTRNVPRGGHAGQIGSEYRYLAEMLGLPTDRFEMAVHYDETAAAFADEVLVQERLRSGYAALCPFTTRPQKHWIDDRWCELAKRLKYELGLAPVLLGGPAEREAAEKLCNETDGSWVNLVGRTSLTEAAALIDRAMLLVGVDTGLSHMGIAAGTPSVLLFGSTCPYLETGRENARVLYHPRPCSPCKRRPTCRGAFDCMQSIRVGEVVDTAREVMGASA